MKVVKVEVPYMSSKSGELVEFTFESKSLEPSIWFIAMMDCEQNMHKKYSRMPKVDLEVTIVNELGSHFSYEERGSL